MPEKYISERGNQLGTGDTHPWNETLEETNEAATSPNGI
jgi:hypothetical protein